MMYEPSRLYCEGQIDQWVCTGSLDGLSPLASLPTLDKGSVSCELLGGVHGLAWPSIEVKRLSQQQDLQR